LFQNDCESDEELEIIFPWVLHISNNFNKCQKIDFFTWFFQFFKCNF
jgi:hypothetical protein